MRQTVSIAPARQPCERSDALDSLYRFKHNTPIPMSDASASTPYGTLPAASPLPARKPVSLPRLQEMRDRGEKITMLTAYDATLSLIHI